MSSPLNLSAGLPPRVFQSFMLVPNTSSYYHGTRIIPLPRNIADLPLEGKKLFIEALKSAATKRFQVLTGEAKDAWILARIQEGQKLVVGGHYTDKIFVLIRITGAICVLVFASTYARL